MAGRGECGEDLRDPAGGEAGVGVDVGDELTGCCGKACLPCEGEAFAGLVHDSYAGIAKGNLARAVGAGVVDDDDLDVIAEALGLGEDGLQASGEVGLLVVGRDDEAEAHRELILAHD